MSWVLNRLLKTTGRTYIGGSEGIPGSSGTAGSPGYYYIEETEVGGGTYESGSPPSGWDSVTTVPLPGGGTQTIRSGGYRFFSGVKAYLTAVVGSLPIYYYTAPTQTVYTQVYVPPVPAQPATPGVPATAAQIIEDYNFGWNSGALGPATLAVNTVVTFRMVAGNIGSIVGLSYATGPQDYGYTGMPFFIMAQSGRYQLFSNGSPVGASTPFVNGDKFSLYRTNVGTVEVYVSGGLIHTEALPEDVVVDSSLYSGGDMIWDTFEQPVALAPLNSDISAPSTSSAQAVAGAVAVTQTLGPGTALGVAGATTVSRGVAGAVTVNGVVNVNIGETSAEGGTGGGMTRTAAIGVAENIGATKTFGAGTALGVIGSTTASDGVAAGDATTGVGISTNVSLSGDMSLLPLTAAGAAPNVFTAWTGNYQGDAVSMLPMTVEASGGLVTPIIAIGESLMAPLSASGTGLSGGVSTSSSGSMLPMAMFASSEAEYSQAYASLYPLTASGTDGVFDPSSFFTVEITEEFFIASPTLLASYSCLFTEGIGAADTPKTFLTYTTQVADDIAALSTYRTAFVLEVAEQYSIADSLTFKQAVNIADALVAQGAVETFYQATVAVISAMVASDRATNAFSDTVSDSMQVSDTITDLLQYLALLTDVVNVGSSLDYQLTITVLLSDNLTIDATQELDARYLASILENVWVMAFIKTPAELAQGWVMNTEGAMPISEYDNYTFNSLAYSPTQMLGCNDEGVYILDGDDDAGTNIDAHLTSLMLDFDTTKLKRMSTAYLGYTSNGRLLLKVRSVDQGEYVEHWYEGRNTGAQTPPGQNRMKLGKGLRSRYWTFELANIDGSDFELDKVELYPIVLQRRV